MSSTQNETKKLIQFVGTTLRELRKEQKLSLEELAVKTGVSKLTLGNIERGETNPTLGMLWKISNGLSVPLMTLLKPENEINILRAGQGPQISEEGQEWILEPLFSDTRGGIEMYRGFLQPHCKYEPESHHPGTIEIATVMSGEVQLTIGESSYTLNKYDSIQFTASEKHIYANLQDEQVVLHLTISYK
ncbi:helix-turn-helix domain-containing protein [Brevibacillus laterosporus]|uniref:XRE family transcriptional regulator n=1 Tax=Brevibacillus laterosporus TaxID=1465 RepID=A0AAP3G7Y0_BRELA|nr:XRE family transcriptional regulator [Brevibacillus laterosporus]MCR8980778.1 XRE family transcriptional regulator [Brevibacillus laterosporus]MCZ0807933.1 XRE family transcriptional regulator [Brevibacillus laterosporus]MCZ0826176.1 XRE family transcriptional regulator [Brevibacillus laterosporus]MCZ0852261.1 XRE family transcriptional regulator [Brevibacillus laterosporus]